MTSSSASSLQDAKSDGKHEDDNQLSQNANAQSQTASGPNESNVDLEKGNSDADIPETEEKPSERDQFKVDFEEGDKVDPKLARLFFDSSCN